MIGENERINNNWDNSMVDLNQSVDKLKFEFEDQPNLIKYLRNYYWAHILKFSLLSIFVLGLLHFE
jgi:hypothetical protein